MGILGPNRQSIRLYEYDYALDGLYYVTICTQDRRPLFGEIKEGEMHRSTIGEVVQKAWLELPRYDPCVSLDEFMVMPDHFHGIVGIDRFGMGFDDGTDCGQARGPAPTRDPLSLSDLMQRFKSWTTWQYRQLEKSSQERLWQRNYYEHIIRNDHLNRGFENTSKIIPTIGFDRIWSSSKANRRRKIRD